MERIVKTFELQIDDKPNGCVTGMRKDYINITYCEKQVNNLIYSNIVFNFVPIN